MTFEQAWKALDQKAKAVTGRTMIGLIDMGALERRLEVKDFSAFVGSGTEALVCAMLKQATSQEDQRMAVATAMASIQLTLMACVEIGMMVGQQMAVEPPAAVH